MANNDVKISKRTLTVYIPAALLFAIVSIYGIILILSSGSDIAALYAVLYVVSFALIAYAGSYAFSHKDKLDGMCCMMVSMTFAMVSSLVAGALIAVPTGDFLIASVLSTAVGFAFGYTFGNIGGSTLARMEGVMAAPMGGTMGAMIGIMMIPFNLAVFTIFLMIVLTIIVAEVMLMVSRTADVRLPRAKSLSLAVFFVIFLSLSFVVPATRSVTGLSVDNSIQAGHAQELTLRATRYGYEPSTITVEKNSPVRISFDADQNAGCSRSLIIPAFKVYKTAPSTVEFTPTQSGSYDFSCSMGMFRGKIIVN